MKREEERAACYNTCHTPCLKQLSPMKCDQKKREEIDRKSKELHTFSHAPRFKQLGQDDLSNGVGDEMEVERVASVKQDALDEGDDIPRRIVARAHNGYVDDL